MKNSDIVIIGGGAGGLAAAIEAKRTNSELKVCVLEHLPRVGKKILATGNGRCNLGNLNANSHAYTNAAFAAFALEKCTPHDLIAFFESMGLFVRADGEGRLYPQSNTAASVLDALRFECALLGVETVCSCNASDVKANKNGFEINGEYRAEKLILACGGRAAPSQGSDGSGFALLKMLGHSLTPTEPSLVQLITDTAKTRSLKGLRARARLSLSSGGESEGEILFTDYGLSGIAAMDLSRFVKPKEKAELILDLAPEQSEETLVRSLGAFAAHNPQLSAENLLSGIVPKAVGAAVMKNALGALPKTAGELTAESVGQIAHGLKHFSLALNGTKGFNDAQVTRGGAQVSEYDRQTLQSKKHRGLFACGEILDVDGACGGFNLEWAFASGRLAGASAAEK